MSLLVQARSRLNWVSQSRKVTALVVSQNRDSKLTGANSRNISFESPSPPSAGPRGHFKHASRRRHRRYVRTESGALGFQRCPNASRRGRAVLAAIAPWKPREKPLRAVYRFQKRGSAGETRVGLDRFRATARGVASRASHPAATRLEPTAVLARHTTRARVPRRVSTLTIDPSHKHHTMR